MQILTLDGVRIEGISAALPARSEDNLARCTELYGSVAKAESVVKATGIRSRRVVDAGTTSLDLCVRAAEDVLKGTGTVPAEIGAVICVTFTPARAMPCNACQAQGRLGLPTDVVAFDLNLACSGWAYGLYTAGLLAQATGKKVLLLDGDAQTPHVDPRDPDTVPVLADAGTATLVAPIPSVDAASRRALPWRFAFLSDGAKGEALTLSAGGTLRMDGFSVFKFVTLDVLRFIEEFLRKTSVDSSAVDAFVPHQANIFMIRQMARKLNLADKIWISGDVLGNSASASVPTTLAWCGRAHVKDSLSPCRILIAGFGGGLSASVGTIDLSGPIYLHAD